ncbi:MAG: MBL fold metallo-hydrolase [Myxococcota bacterium]|nr:MBL fold metallo-hydrolase [Myxococcota bacterium]
MLPLFRRDLVVASLSSGSKGNCTYVGDKDAGVLIDCGPSTKRILSLMESVGLENAPINAVLITHEHSDHIGAARILSNKLAKLRGGPIPFFMTPGTLKGANPKSVPDTVEVVEAGEGFRVKHLDIDPFTVPHDVEDPVAYRVNVGDRAAAVVTDLGRPTSLVAQKMQDVDVLVLEYNHDEQMLLEGPYPWALKQRIRSNHGHLSNAQASELLSRGATDRLKHLVLAHLSDENNSPDLAVRSARKVLGDAPVKIRVARQLDSVGAIRVEASAC